MARYYESEALIDFVKQNTPHFNSETTMECVERAIRNAPTADVAPRSEVEALEKEIDRLNHILNCYALQYGTVKDQSKTINKVKTEVASEILSDLKIEAHNKAVHPCGCKIDPYISLKVLDGIIQKYINEYYEEGKKI